MRILRNLIILPFIILNLSCGEGELETWLAIGQSNMYRSIDSWEDSRSASVQVKRLDFEDAETEILDWTPIDQVDEFSSVAGHFAIDYSRRTEKEIRIYSNAIGGTRLGCWLTGICWKKQVRDVNDRIDGIIWWQGESDAMNANAFEVYETLDEDYEENFLKFVSQIREHFLRPKLPIVIVSLAKFCHNSDVENCRELDTWHTVRQAQERIAKNDLNIDFVRIYELTDGELHPEYIYEYVGENLARKAFLIKK